MYGLTVCRKKSRKTKFTKIYKVQQFMQRHVRLPSEGNTAHDEEDMEPGEIKVL